MDSTFAELQHTSAALLARIDDFLQWLRTTKTGLTDLDYFRFCVPISKHIERLHMDLDVGQIQTADLVALRRGEESESDRGVALLQKAIVDSWPLPIVAGEVSGVILPRYDTKMLVRIFSEMRSRLEVAIRLMGGGRSTPNTRYRKSELRSLTGLEDDAINKYLTALKIRKAPRGRGGSTFEWTKKEVHDLLNGIISESGQIDIKAKCKKALSNM